MSRMFDVVTKTWNPVKGCYHNCIYCYARILAETRLKETEKYKDGFKPAFFPKELSRRFGPRDVVFVVDMGDLFGSWVPSDWIRAVIEATKKSEATFLYLTKNPRRYHEFLHLFPENSILGATIESNWDHGISNAPPPTERFRAMRELEWRKFISIEPVLDFDLDEMVGWMKEIRPEFVYIGYDNWRKVPRYLEPPLSRVRMLIERLREITEVRVKTLRGRGIEPWLEEVVEA